MIDAKANALFNLRILSLKLTASLDFSMKGSLDTSETETKVCSSGRDTFPFS